MTEPAKAVFLSYASQEAEAAQRICDALRAAGNSIMIAREGLCIQHTPNRRDKVLGRIAPDALLKFAKKQ